MNLMKNQIIQKSQSFEIFEGQGFKAKDPFKNHSAKNLCPIGSKCLPLGASHMCKK